MHLPCCLHAVCAPKHPSAQHCALPLTARTHTPPPPNITSGSERVDRSEVTGQQLKEAAAINKSLSALGDVVSALQKRSAHVPFRNSTLTQVGGWQPNGGGCGGRGQATLQSWRHHSCLLPRCAYTLSMPLAHRSIIATLQVQGCRHRSRARMAAHIAATYPCAVLLHASSPLWPRRCCRTRCVAAARCCWCASCRLKQPAARRPSPPSTLPRGRPRWSWARRGAQPASGQARPARARVGARRARSAAAARVQQSVALQVVAARARAGR